MNPVAKEFDAVAPHYESNRLGPWYKAHADVILRHLPSRLSGPVLDVGCGTGYLLRRLSYEQPHLRLTGIDVAPKMIEHAMATANKHPSGSIEFVCADWETLDIDSLEQRPFEIAVCANALHYFSDLKAAADKLHEVLAESGTLFVLERDRSASMLTSLWGWLHRHLIRDHVMFHAEEKLIHTFAGAGFESVRVVTRINRLMWKNKLYTSVLLLKCEKSRPDESNTARRIAPPAPTSGIR